MLSGSASPMVSDLFWAKPVVKARKVKNRDKKALQKIFFIFLNRFLIKFKDCKCSFCVVAKLLRKGLFLNEFFYGLWFCGLFVSWFLGFS